MTLEGSLDVAVDPESVGFSFVVHNEGDTPETLEFRSGQSAEFVVYEDRTEAYRWSDGRMFTQAIRTETIEPGDSVIYSGEWPEPDTGTFKVVASLEAVERTVEASAEFYVY